MPPRHAYWTILVDEQPTAFRAALVEDLQPTFKRLKEKHPSARVVWFQNGKVWNSRLDAQEAMHARGEMGRRGDVRQQGGFRDRNRQTRPEQADRRDPSGKLEWKPKGAPGATPGPQDPGTLGPRSRPSATREGGKLEWKPKGEAAKRPRPEWRPRTSSPGAPGFGRGKTAERPKLDWKPKGAPGTSSPSTFAKATVDKQARRPPRPRPSAKRESGLEWRPKSQAPDEKKREWIPKKEYKKAQGSKPKARDKTWRPGGEHRDPRQKYKDAKKAKWTRFKQNVRKRWEAKQPRKKKDDE